MVNIINTNNIMRSMFIKNGTYCFIERDKYETIERFNERGWFVVSALFCSYEMEEAIKLSRVWTNIMFDKCTYNDDLITKINKILSIQ